MNTSQPRPKADLRTVSGRLLRGVVGLFLLGLGSLAGSIGVVQAQPVAPCAELTVDGSLETGDPAWQMHSAGGYPLISPLLPHTGQQSAYLGGYNMAEDTLAQAVALPTDAKIMLRFWWWMTTEETDHPWDTLDLVLSPAAGGTETQIHRWDDSALVGSWQLATFDLSGYAGQQMRFTLRSLTDDTNPTSFYLDDFSIEACPNLVPSSRKSYLPMLRAGSR